MADPTCVITGNPDLYGVGVRIGLYSQWAATLLATIFDPSSESSFRIANLIIQAAIFIGLCSESGHRTNAVGAVITQFLLCGSLSSLTGDGISHLGHASGLLRIIFYMALSGYGCWFWFDGIESMAKKGCEEVIFFGGNGIHGPIRSLGKAIAVIGIVGSVVVFCLSVWATRDRFRDGLKAGFTPPAKRRPQVEIGLLILSMGLIGLSVSAVEYLISTNDIQGVDQIDSVGQLIPLLAGTVASGLTIWNIVVHGLFFRKRCWFFFGWHL